MKNNFINKKDGVRVEFISQEVSIIETNDFKKVLIACDEAGYNSLKNYIYNEFFNGITNCISYTNNSETIISMYVDQLQTMISNVCCCVSGGFKPSVKYPKLFYMVLTDNKYGYIADDLQKYISDQEIDNLKNCVDDYEYEILSDDDYNLLEEENLIIHTPVSFRFVSDRFISKIIENYIPNKETFISSMIYGTFVIPSEIENNEGLLKIWKENCSSSYRIFKESVSQIGNSVVTSSILPDTIAYETTITASIFDYIQFFNKIGNNSDLTYSSGFKKLINDMSFFFKKYEHVADLNKAINSCINLLNSEPLPF